LPEQRVDAPTAIDPSDDARGFQPVKDEEYFVAPHGAIFFPDLWTARCRVLRRPLARSNGRRPATSCSEPQHGLEGGFVRHMADSQRVGVGSGARIGKGGGPEFPVVPDIKDWRASAMNQTAA
jgi:hypothetical protein